MKRGVSVEMPYVDLHVHSYHSDGSMSPHAIVKAACAHGVGILAVADHDNLAGALSVQKACASHGIRCIPAVEIDALDGDVNIHVLAYGFNPHDRPFRAFLRHTRFLLDERSIKLIELMAHDYASVSLPDYMDFTRDIRLGGWKALHYFMAKGLTASLKEGIRFYPQYAVTYAQSGFATVHAIAYRIHKAGGYAVLAHPGEVLDTADMGHFEAALGRLAAFGLDGIECYYPTHGAHVTRACLALCRANGLLITAGSDCHGVFGKTRVGEMNITRDQVSLGPLLGG